MQKIKIILAVLFAVIIIVYQLGINIVYSNWADRTYITKSLKDFSANYIVNQQFISSKILNSLGFCTAWTAFTFPPHYDFRYKITGKFNTNNTSNKLLDLFNFPASEYPYDIINSHLINFRDGKFSLLLFNNIVYQKYYSEYLCRKNKTLESVNFEHYYRNTLDTHTALYQKKLSQPYSSELVKFKEQNYQCKSFK